MPTADDRRDAWADAVFDAVAVLRAAMTDPASPRAFDAAAEVLRLEIARLRHDRPVAGTAEPVEDGESELPPFAFGPPVPADVEEWERDIFEGNYDESNCAADQPGA